jgi:hypothetical protein
MATSTPASAATGAPPPRGRNGALFTSLWMAATAALAAVAVADLVIGGASADPEDLAAFTVEAMRR